MEKVKIELKKRYFLCKESFEYRLTEEEMPTHYGNSFTASVSWSWSYTSGTYGNYYHEPGKRLFTGGRTYLLIMSDGEQITLYDDLGSYFNVSSHGYEDKFIEIVVDLNEEEKKLINLIKEKGYIANISPSQAVYNREKDCVEDILYSIFISDQKHIEGWTNLGCICLNTNNLINGLLKGVRNLMRKSEGAEIIRNCLKGKYSYYISLKKSFISTPTSGFINPFR
jgi:hypothetical protein